MALIDGVPTSQQESLTVSTTAVTLTAGVYGPSNTSTALIQVTSGSINYSLHGSGTPTTTDFYATLGDSFTVRPAKMLRMVRNGGTDAVVKVQGFE